jgi:formate dehydrogenase iron-sulfur subunit
MGKALLIDTTRCIGCRSCQVSCKQWNDLPAERTEILPGPYGMQNPEKLSATTFSVITTSEIAASDAPGGVRMVFTKRQCMHCLDPACASACPVTALSRTPSGAVTYDASKCIGCRYCQWACPFGAPTAEWTSLAPRIRKCTLCADRAGQPLPETRNGQALTPEDRQSYHQARETPTCVRQCPAEALKFGDRDELIALAHRRIQATPGRYVDHVYGEKEAGGTALLYLSKVPFAEIGLPDVGTQSYPARSVAALSAVPPAVIAAGAVLGGTYALLKRKEDVAAAEAKPEAHADHHPEFAPLEKKLLTPFNLLLLAVVAFGVISLAVRFVTGLGKSTNLSDTYAWGLWIVFDLVWIAVAAGAFATAGIIYVLRRHDLYGIGRGAVLLGLLSYSFVMITLLADLGLPWHFWQLAVQAPKHSAMFEVSWCVGLYVTILAMEFLPVPLERWGLTRLTELWRRYAPLYVVAAVTLFVYLMSRNLVYTGAAFAVFALLAYAFRAKGSEKPVPIMLAIAAVTFSTMHQSSLGSLFLLMPDKLNNLWWSPILPINFFLSSVAAGLGLILLVELWIAKAYQRPVQVPQLATLGRFVGIALGLYLSVRIVDLVYRGQLATLMTNPKRELFLAEFILGGLIPLGMMAFDRVRSSPLLVGIGAFLVTAGITFNRANVVLFAMELKGTMPQTAPASYTPSVFEWGVSLGLIALTIFLFGWGVRLFPVLPKLEQPKAANG